MTLWLTILGMGAVTFGTRLLPFLIVERFEVPERARQALSYVLVSVLAAIVAQELFAPSGQFDLSTGNLRLIAGVAGIVAAAIWHNIVITIAVGMTTLWLLQWLT